MTRADLAIVGGGPAGCAAAVMADSLGMTSVLVEPRRLGEKLYSIPALGNVLGGARTGPELAAAITADVAGAAGCEVRSGRAVSLQASDDGVRVELDAAGPVLARYAVVATGVLPLRPADVDWVAAPADLPVLWEASAAELAGRDVLVLGADRPLGTALRALSDVDARLFVVYPPAERYKADEVRADPRVTLLPAAGVRVGAEGMATIRLAGGGVRELAVAGTYRNLGVRAARLTGLAGDDTGYFPPERQHPRVLVAGDLRGARFQRIMTAAGSGAEAALAAYYRGYDLV